MQSIRHSAFQSIHPPQSSSSQPKLYGVHFPENNIANHPGHLLIRRLAEGQFGTAILVLSLADNNLFVRKIDLYATRRRDDVEIQSAEVRNHLNHPNVPKLISHYEYSVPRPGEMASHLSFQDPIAAKTISTWQFCNGGTLARLLADINMDDHELVAELTQRGYGDVTPRLPEAFIWKYFDSRLSLLVHVHGKGITHADGHSDNVFFHWPTPASVFPDFYLGDWGNSREYPWSDHSDPIQNIPFRVSNIHQLDEKSTTTTGRRPLSYPDAVSWYLSWTYDLRDLVASLVELLTGNDTEMNRDALRDYAAAKKRFDIYSHTLIGHIVELFTSTGQHVDVVNPQQTFDKCKTLQVTVHRWATAKQNEFVNQANPGRNLLKAMKVPDQDPTPMTWPARNRVACHNTVRGIEFDKNQYQVCRIKRVGGRWRLDTDDPSSPIIPEGSDSDDSDGNDHDSDNHGGYVIEDPIRRDRRHPASPSPATASQERQRQQEQYYRQHEPQYQQHLEEQQRLQQEQQLREAQRQQRRHDELQLQLQYLKTFQKIQRRRERRAQQNTTPSPETPRMQLFNDYFGDLQTDIDNLIMMTGGQKEKHGTRTVECDHDDYPYDMSQYHDIVGVGGDIATALEMVEAQEEWDRLQRGV